jgi:hypothetical protein
MMMMIQMIAMNLIQTIQVQRKKMSEIVLMIIKVRRKVLQKITQKV